MLSMYMPVLVLTLAAVGSEWSASALHAFPHEDGQKDKSSTIKNS